MTVAYRPVYFPSVELFKQVYLNIPLTLERAWNFIVCVCVYELFIQSIRSKTD